MGEDPEVDTSFIQSPEHRPTSQIIEAGGIPLINLSSLTSPEESLSNPSDETIAAIGDACRNWGFFQVINHGVPSDTRRKIEAAAREFFALTKDEKQRVKRGEDNPLGYYDKEHTKNVRDWKEVFDFTVKDPLVIPASDEIRVTELEETFNQWPIHPSGFREACEEYCKEVQILGFRLLELISLSLGLPCDRLNAYFEGDQTSFVRLNHYPPCPIPELALGVGRHKDAGALTVLMQDDVGGLEVKRKEDGKWVFVKPTPNAFIINVGDIIQVWSNARYESVEHRVKVNSLKERLSIPFFFNPSQALNVRPLEELTAAPKYREYNWGRFFAARKLSNFKKLNVENIQINNFGVE